MFSLALRPLFIRSQRTVFIGIRRDLSLKFMRDQIQRKETKLQTIQDLVMKRNVETNGDIDWNGLIGELIGQRLVYRQNFEMDLMSAFLLNNGNDCQKVDQKLFKSLIGFIKSLPNMSGQNSIAVSRYCHFVSHFNAFVDKSDIDLIRRTTDQFVDKYLKKRITNDVMNYSVTALAISSKDNCLHAMQLLDRLDVINIKLFNHLIDSSIRFKLFDQSIDLINRYPDLKLNEEVVTKVIQCLTQFNPSLDQTIQLFKIFSKNLIVFDFKSKPEFIEIMKRFSYKTSKTSVGRNGLCLKCEQTLSGLSSEERKRLSEEFRSVVFDKENNLMIASFEEYERELKNFERFLTKISSDKPLDLVIDGLNMAFYTHANIIEDRNQLRQYVQTYKRENIDRNIVEIITRNNVLENYRNILIVGRKHMKNWKQLKRLVSEQSDRISMFYTMDKTQDDCYVLYAAIQTIQTANTCLVSNDLYRDYSERMSAKSTLFQRWLSSHQILLKQSKDFKLPDHFDYKIHMSADNRVIHIPFQCSDNSQINWICCQLI